MARSNRWPVATTIALVATIAVIAFGMSFVAMRDLMERAGFPGQVAWGLPVLVDGTIVAAMVFLFARRGIRGGDRAMAWTLLGGFAVVSVVCNGVHTSVIYDPTRGMALPFAIFLGMLPPIGLLGSSELLVRLLAPASSAAEVEAAEGVPSPQTAAQPLAAAAEAAPEVLAEPVIAVAAEPAAPVAAAEDPATTGDEAVAAATTGGNEASEPTGEEIDVAATIAAPVAAAELPVAEEVATGEPAEEETAEQAEAPATALHVVEPELPTTASGQVEWVIERARTGRDVSWRSVMDALQVSGRQAQRRVTEARKRAPEAFAA